MVRRYVFPSLRLLVWAVIAVALVKIAFAGADVSTQATGEQQSLAMKYVTMKQGWLRQNSFSYLADAPFDPLLFDTPVDARLLLALCHIHRQEYAPARALLPETNAAFRCLKALLDGESPQALTALYSAEAVNAAVRVLRQPLAVLSF